MQRPRRSSSRWTRATAVVLTWACGPSPGTTEDASSEDTSVPNASSGPEPSSTTDALDGSTTDVPAPSTTSESSSDGTTTEPGLLFPPTAVLTIVNCSESNPALALMVDTTHTGPRCTFEIFGPDLMLIGITPWDGLSGTHATTGAAVASFADEPLAGEIEVMVDEPWQPVGLRLDLAGAGTSFVGELVLSACLTDFCDDGPGAGSTG